MERETVRLNTSEALRVSEDTEDYPTDNREVLTILVGRKSQGIFLSKLKITWTNISRMHDV